MRGDCIACQRLDVCSETSVERVKASYTCPIFIEVPEAIDQARLDLISTYGDEAIKTLLQKPMPTENPQQDEEQEEEDEDGTEF